jgi:hypothetical protein
MIAIHTKFLKATNTYGARIKAYTVGFGSVKGFTATVPYDYSVDVTEAHFEAVKALVRWNKLDWNLTNMRYGDSSDGNGFVFCFNGSVVLSTLENRKAA